MKQPKSQALTAALDDWADMQAVVGDTVILVRDFRGYSSGGMIVKIDGEEPDGIHNSYYSVCEIERDLVNVVPGYTAGAAIWQEGEYDY